MTTQERDRIESAIRHIQTSVDIDPWAMEIAVEAMRKQMEDLKNSPTQMSGTSDLISRQAAIDAVHKNYDTILDFKSNGYTIASSFEDIINDLPSAQPNWCDGCKWEYAFGYGECHHCKRNFNDMYEVKDEG